MEEYKPTLGDFMPDERQYDREAKYTICDLRELFAFFKEMGNSDASSQAALDKHANEIKTNTAEIADVAKP